MTTEIAVRESGAAIAEQVVIRGDLSKLSEEQRVLYYMETCRSLGLNPLTRPFEYITLNGKLTLYATRSATDQLRVLRGITITGLDPRQVGELLVVVATGRDRDGRDDSSTGAVSVKGLGGEALANAMMKAETKAKRRLTLSLAGLGMTDESEVGSIPSAEPASVDLETGEIRRPSLAERVAEKAATVAPTTPVEPRSEPIEAAVVEAPTEALFAEKPAMTAPEFKVRLGASDIAVTAAADKFHELFPDVSAMRELTDEQRAELWAALT